MLIYTEITPNPHSLKFVLPPEYPAVERGTREATEPTPQDEPLLQALWAIPGVRGLFFTRAFITVSKSEEASWHELIPKVKEVLQTYLPLGPLAASESAGEATDKASIEGQIRAILEEYIRPGIAMDGGDVEFLSFNDGVVKLRLYGSCVGCPSSLYTLKAGIENLLTRLVPEVRAVEAE
ncbi:MAG: NifU family protein [Bacteroidia bacterium]|nr:NifU family protein [Bacteroidia bacterium]MCX7763873.1 NifU family protein [Bacteroidia bacterium]MDW8056804.1 NifU family protein [Bacteroidia bacterium]